VEKELTVPDNTRIQVLPYTTIYYTADFVGTSPEFAKRFAYSIKGIIDNYDGTNISDLGNLYEVVIYSDDSAISVDVRANNYYDTLNFYVTGSEDYTIKWLVYVTTLEVYHGP
jgi:hypothetical protein